MGETATQEQYRTGPALHTKTVVHEYTGSVNSAIDPNKVPDPNRRENLNHPGFYTNGERIISTPVPTVSPRATPAAATPAPVSSEPSILESLKRLFHLSAADVSNPHEFKPAPTQAQLQSGKQTQIG